jgi:hypothetical protein
MLAPELNFLHPDRPRLHVWPIAVHGQDADSSQVLLLADLFEGARRATCIEPPDHCTFSPSYALRFHSTKEPLDMLISSDCMRWCFLRGEGKVGEYGPRVSEVGDSLRVLLSRLFPGLTGPE